MLVGYFAVLVLLFGQEFESCSQDSFRKTLHRFKGKDAKLLVFCPYDSLNFSESVSTWNSLRASRAARVPCQISHLSAGHAVPPWSCSSCVFISLAIA